jgi:hypothetical protein
LSVDNSCFSQRLYCGLKKNTINAKEVTVATLIVYMIVRLPQDKIKGCIGAELIFPVSAIMVYV